VIAVTFLSSGRLWLLILVALLVAAYVWRQLRRKDDAVRFTNLALLETVAPKRPGWRRHVPAAAFVVGVIGLLLGFAKPATAVRVPIDEATVMVAIDVSGSMAATDVSPNRLQAAQAAATSFVNLLPPKFKVGLVSFAQQASVVVPPTTDHAQVAAAINGLQIGGGTAIGEAIYASLDSLAADPQPDTSQGVPARIVLMSDGSTNSGRPDDEAAQAAATAHVPVSTIAYGTDAGEVTVGGRTVAVPADKDTLQAIAKTTGGKYFEAASASQLKQVYDTIRTGVSSRTIHRDVSGWFLGTALVLLGLAGIGSLLWTPRLP
jgi:Ca-activated chloride channel homolog